MSSAARVIVGIDIGGTSIKCVALAGEHTLAECRSPRYARPDRATLTRMLHEVGEDVRRSVGGAIEAVGVCAPGLIDDRGVIIRAVNAPGLEGLSHADIARLAGFSDVPGGVHAATDARAAATDFVCSHPEPMGRVLAISLGTGVGACVLDEGVPLIVSGLGPGHLGQIDVSLGEPDAPVGPDGGVGSLEAYMGLPALKRRFGSDLSRGLAEAQVHQPPLAGLVRAVRIAHAIYRPQRVVLLGGVGLALAGRGLELYQAIGAGLTSLARPGWSLEFGTTDLHAARGAARVAAGLAGVRHR